MAKIKKTFSLESETIKLLEQIASDESLTQSETLKRAIDVLNESLQSKQGNNKALISSLQAHIKDLQAQVSVKDEQISALNENLKAQQTISALISPSAIKNLSAGAGVSKAPRGLFSKIFNRKNNEQIESE